jgi:hypothetical protein
VNFTLKDFIQVAVLFGSLITFYFTMVMSFETRITRLETLENGLRRDMTELKSDVKEILREVRAR